MKNTTAAAAYAEARIAAYDAIQLTPEERTAYAAKLGRTEAEAETILADFKDLLRDILTACARITDMLASTIKDAHDAQAAGMTLDMTQIEAVAVIWREHEVDTKSLDDIAGRTWADLLSTRDRLYRRGLDLWMLLGGGDEATSAAAH